MRQQRLEVHVSCPGIISQQLKSGLSDQLLTPRRLSRAWGVAVPVSQKERSTVDSLQLPHSTDPSQYLPHVLNVFLL